MAEVYPSILARELEGNVRSMFQKQRSIGPMGRLTSGQGPIEPEGNIGSPDAYQGPGRGRCSAPPPEVAGQMTV